MTSSMTAGHFYKINKSAHCFLSKGQYSLVVVLLQFLKFNLKNEFQI